MARTFRDDMADDLANVLLNADEGAERVTYLPAAGGSVSLVASIRHTGQRGEADWVDSDDDEIQVLITNNPDSAAGGIARPGPGDRLDRGDGRPYGFERFESANEPDSWRLVFKRTLPNAAGPAAFR